MTTDRLLRPVIFVLGMQRSGTSMLAGCLQEGGWTTPGVSAWEPDNQRGNRESLTINRLVANLLTQSGGSWRVPVDRVIWSETNRLERDQIIEGLLAASSLPVVKSPSILLTVPFWQDRLPCRPLYVGIVRHPLAVAASLQVRNGISISEGCRLWTAHNLALEQLWTATPFPLVALDVPLEQLADDIAKVASLLAAQAGRPAPEPAALRRFIDGDLIHHREESFTSAEYSDDPVCVQAFALFARLRAKSLQPLPPTAPPSVGFPSCSRKNTSLDAANRAERGNCWAEARSLLEQAEKESPDPGGIRQRLAKLLRRLGDGNALDRLAGAHGEANPGILACAALLAFEQHEPSRMEHWLCRLRSAAPQHGETLLLEGLLAGVKGDWPAMAVHVAKALQHESLTSPMSGFFTRLWQHLPDATSPSALNALTAAAASIPAEAAIALWNLRALLAEKDSDFAGACEALDRAVAIAPANQFRLLLHRGALRLRCGNRNGLADFAAASDLVSSDIEVAAMWGRAALEQADFAEAARAIHRMETIQHWHPLTCRYVYELSEARKKSLVSPVHG